MLRFDATQILREKQEKAAAILKATADDVLAISKPLVPVKTGALKASGRVEVIGPAKVRVGYGNEAVDYAKFQEFGTSVTEAQPFLTPAFAQTESILRRRAADTAQASHIPVSER